MLRTTFRTALTLALLGSSAAFALAQAQAQVTPIQTGNQATLRAKSILGASVSLQTGTGVGTVEDIILNSDGVVDYLIVSEGGKLVTVPWEAAKFNHERRTAVINITPEQFRQVPTFTQD